MQPLFIAFVVTVAAAPVTRRIATTLQIVDRSAGQKRHVAPIPLLGGLAMLAGWSAATLVQPQRDPLWGIVMAGAILIFLLGAWDDARHVGPIKLLIELAIISLFLGFGPRQSLPGHLLPVAILWVVGVVNAMNCLDCADGSATVVALVSSIGLALLGISWGQYHTPLILALTGAAAGFLPYNLPPAQQFMGDAGSKFLGFTLAMAGLLVLPPNPMPSHLIAVALVLGIPVADFVIVHLRRYRSHTRNIFDLMTARGNDHLPHRLMHAGLSPRRMLVALVGLAIMAAFLSGVAAVGVIPSLVATAALIVVMLGLEVMLGRRKVLGKVPMAPVELPTSFGG